MPAPLHVVILAAGEGKRMKSAKPKVLQTVAGIPMLQHVVDTARTLEPAGIHVVYGHRGEQVRAAFAGQADLDWVEQTVRLALRAAAMAKTWTLPLELNSRWPRDGSSFIDNPASLTSGIAKSSGASESE